MRAAKVVTPQDRHDLFAEARNLEPRFQLAAANTVAGADRPIVIGLPKGGGLKLYLGPDFMIGLSPEGELRRAFHAEKLYRAEPGRALTVLVDEFSGDGPQRSRTRHSRRLSSDKAAAFCELAEASLRSLLGELLGSPVIERAYPKTAGERELGSLMAFLKSSLDRGLRIADGL